MSPPPSSPEYEESSGSGSPPSSTPKQTSQIIISLDGADVSTPTKVADLANALYDELKSNLTPEQQEASVFKVVKKIETAITMTVPNELTGGPFGTTHWMVGPLKVSLSVEDGVAVLSFSPASRRRLLEASRGRKLTTDSTGDFATEVAVPMYTSSEANSDSDISSQLAVADTIAASLTAPTGPGGFMETLATAIADTGAAGVVVTGVAPPTTEVEALLEVVSEAGSTDAAAAATALDGVTVADLSAALVSAGITGVSIETEVASTNEPPSMPPPTPPPSPSPPSCSGENPTFYDAGSYQCDAWESYDCATAVEQYSYTNAQTAALIAACPICCAGSTPVTVDDNNTDDDKKTDEEDKDDDGGAPIGAIIGGVIGGIVLIGLIGFGAYFIMSKKGAASQNDYNQGATQHV